LGSRDCVSEPIPRDGTGTAIRADRRDPDSAASDPRGGGGKKRRDLGAGLPDLDRSSAAGGAEGGGAGAEIGEQIDFSGGEARRTVIGDPRIILS